MQQNDFTSFPGKIHLIDSDQKLLAVQNDLLKADTFGFDTETKPSFKKGEVYKVSLVQLSTETDAYLIRLLKISKVQILKDIFENAQVVKAGVAVRDDLKQLQKSFSFNPAGFVELQDVAKKQGLENFGLKGMAEEVLNFTITKGPKLTNWEAFELTDQQMKYAATDAWLGLMLYKKMVGATEQIL